MLEKIKKKLPALIICLIASALLVAADQISKAAISQSIPFGDSRVVIPGFFELTNVRNTGAAFSSMDGIGMWFFILLTFIAIGFILYFFVSTRSKWMEISLGLILAGAVGNLIDRIVFGYVRDFFLFYIFGSPFAVFNVADVCITLGFIGLALCMLDDEIKQRKVKHHE